MSDGSPAADAGTDASTSTVYNGSIPCVGCGDMLSPVAAAYVTDKRCHHCRKKRHRDHIKRGMHT